MTPGIVGTAAIAAMALAAGALGRRRLPVGLPEGLCIAALSGLLAASSVGNRGLPASLLPLGSSLTALAVIWFVVGAVLERSASCKTEESEAARRAVPRRMALHASAVCGLLAVAVVLTMASTGQRGPGAALLLLVLAAIVGAWACLWGGALSRYAAIILLILLTRLAIGRERVESWAHSGVPSLLVVGAAALVAAVVVLLWDWRRRARIWRVQPQRLVEPPPRHARLFSLIVVTGVAVGIGGALRANAGGRPIGIALAALAVSIVGHRWRSNAVGELGLALVAVSVITAGYAWFGGSPAAALLGWAAAGVYLFWLAGFWRQQLDDGKPWTTAGRLIPAARRLGFATVGGQVVTAAAWLLRPDADLAASGGVAAAAAAVILVYWWTLERSTGASSGEPASGGWVTLKAFLVVACAMLPLARFLESLGMRPEPPPVLLAAGTALLAAVAQARRRTVGPAWAYNAYIGGVAPVLVLYGLTWSGTWSSFRSVGWATTFLLMALVSRWSLRDTARAA